MNHSAETYKHDGSDQAMAITSTNKMSHEHVLIIYTYIIRIVVFIRHMVAKLVNDISIHRDGVLGDGGDNSHDLMFVANQINVMYATYFNNILCVDMQYHISKLYITDNCILYPILSIKGVYIHTHQTTNLYINCIQLDKLYNGWTYTPHSIIERQIYAIMINIYELLLVTIDVLPESSDA
jgi:hypothetical protein